MDSPKVQLGCGTLAVIAFIVMIFSNANRSSSDARELKSEIRALRNEVQELQRIVQRQGRVPVKIPENLKPEQEPAPR